jgi:hypothetical protein
MDLFKWNIWRGGIFKQIRFLFSVPESAQMVVYISESGMASQELLPLYTGFVSSSKREKEWADLHQVKFQVQKNGVPVQDESVVVISDRSYLPLDPFGTLKLADQEKMASLGDIARLRHTQARSKAGRAGDPRAQLTSFIVSASFTMLGLFALVTLIKGC